VLRLLRLPSLQESRLHTEAAGSAPPDAFGPFRVLHQIGNGALGPVFRAFDQDRDRLVAIKLFRLDLPPERVHQLVGEFEKLIAAGLQHPVIAAPRATGIDGNSAYLAQDFAAADSLDIVLRENGAAPAAEALRVAGQLAAALDFAADRQIVHGALHPRDILLSQEDIRIVGLGVARALERVGVTAPVRRPYAAPERINDEGWDRSADVFSLAAIVYEFLSGRRVTGTGSDAAEGLTEVRGAEGVDIDAVQRVFALALASDPAYRFASATSFTDALKGAIGVDVAPAESTPTPKAKARRPRSGLRVVSEQPVSEALPLVEAMEIVQEVQAVQEVPEVQPEQAAPVRSRRRRRTPAPTPVAIETVALAPSDVEEIPEAPQAPEVQELVLADTEPAPVEELALNVVEEPEPAAELAIELAPVEEPAVAMPAEFAPVEEPVAAVEEPAMALDSFSPEPFVPEPSNPQSPIPNPFVEPPSHSASPVWPIGVAAIIGIALGFGAGYTVAIRAVVPAPVTTTAVAGTAQPPQAATNVTEVVADPVVKLPAAERPAAARPAPAAAKPAAAAVAFSGRVLVRSTPSGARVIVDGKDRGRTPATIRDLGRGEHRLRIVRNGYATAERRVTVSPAQPSQSLSVPLKRESALPRPPAPRQGAAAAAQAGPGALVVDSRPRGAAVFVDGRQVGRTPLTLKDMRAGSHAVRLERAGYRAWTADVPIAAGQQNRVTASLEK